MDFKRNYLPSRLCDTLCIQLFFICTFFFTNNLQGQVFWTDDFQTTAPTSGVRSAPNHTNTTDGTGPAGVPNCGVGNYYFRTNDPGDPMDATSGLTAVFTGYEGTHYWRGEDLDACQANPDVVDFTGINITGKTNLTFRGLFGCRTTTSFETTDEIRVEYQIDGGGYTTGIVFEPNATNTILAHDTNNDGVGDIDLAEAFAEFTFAIPGTGATLDLRITCNANGGGEEFGFDFFRMDEVAPSIVCPTVGAASASETAVCVNETFNATASGLVGMDMTTNMEQDFGIEFVAFTTTPANPYTGGTSLGTVPFGSLTAGNTTAALVGATLATAGSYEIYAILSPTPTDATCRPSAMTTITVNALPAVTMSIPAAQDEFCVDATIQVINLAGSPTGGIYSGPGVMDLGNGISFTFNPGTAGVGNHTVTYTFTDGNGCTNTATDNILVNALPVVTFTALADLCVNDGVQNNLGGGTPTGGVYSGTGVTDDGNGMTYDFDPAAAGVGTHIITYTFTDANGCANSASDDVQVFAVPTVMFTALADLCLDAGVQSNLGGGTPTGGVYSGTGVTDDGNGMTYDFDPAAAGSGTTTITYTVGVAGCSGSAMDDVVVFALPSVTMSIAATEDEYCVDDATVAINLAGSPSGGTYSGPGVMDLGNGISFSFNPATAGVGNHTVAYSFTDGNGCTNTATDNIVVNALPVVTFTALADLCVNDGVQNNLGGGTPTGGVYSGAGVTDDGNGMTYDFDPAAAGVGTHTITYTFTDANGCENSASDDVEVFALPVVTFTALADLCINNGVQNNLGGGTPTGGVYSGAGVTDDGNGMTYDFDPAAAGLGTHTISYTVSVAGCSSTAMDDVEVFALPGLPDVTFPQEVCIDAGVTTLGPLCAPCTGAVYSGTGVTDNGNGTDFDFDPSVAGVGVTPVTVTLTNANGCVREVMVNVTVNALPTVTFTALADLCVDAGIQAGLGGGTPPEGTVVGDMGVYSGTGVTDDGNGMTYSFNPAAAGVGVHTLTYTYTDDNGCTNSASDNIEVFALPIVTFTAPMLEVCVEDGVETGLGGGMPTGGIYSGTGVTDNGNGMTFSFDPTASAPAGGNVTVTYTFTDANGCSASANDDIFVDPVCCDLVVDCSNITDQTLSCRADLPAVDFDLPIVTDSCGNITLSALTIIPGNSGCPGDEVTITRTYFIQDGVSPTVECMQTFTVISNVLPTIMCPGPVMVECVADIPPVDLTAVTATVECGTPTVTHVGDVSDGMTCPETITRTYRVTDACNRTADCTQTITVNDVTPPVPPAAPAAVMVQCVEDIPVPVDLTATDNCDGMITVGPTAVITPGACPNQFTMVRTWTFTDACNNPASVMQTITVNDNIAPTLSAMPASETVECDAIPAAPAITATDNCVIVEPVLFVNEIHYDNTGGDVGEFLEIAGMAGIDLANYEVYAYENFDGQFDAQVQLSGIIPDEGAGFGAIAFTRTELPTGFFENGSREGIALVEIASQEVIKFISYEGTVTASNGPAAGMTSTDIGVSEPFSTPVGQSLQLTGANGCACTDFTWTGPSAESPGLINAGQSFDMTACPQTNDVDVMLSEVTAPGACANEFTLTRTWTAIDDCGNTATHTQTITVEDNTAPVFCDPPMDMDVTCIVPDAEPILAVDNCGGGGPVAWINEIHYDNTGGDVGEFIEIAGSAGTDLSGYELAAYDSDDMLDAQLPLSGIIPDEGCGFGAIAFFLGDLNSQFFENGPEEGRALIEIGGGVIDFISYEGTVNASNGPAAGMTSLDIGVSEPSNTPVGQSLQLTGMGFSGASFTWTGPLTDSPGLLNAGQTIATAPGINVVFDEVVVGDECVGGTVTRTWTATDECGNSDSHTQVITILPAPPPTITCPADEVVTCFEDIVADPANATATAGCGSIVAVYVKQPLISGGIPGCDGVTYTYIYKAIDECGNVAQCEQQFLIQNNAPTISVDPGFAVECFSDIEVSESDATVTTDCEGDYTLTLIPPVIDGPLCGGDVVTYTYRVIDFCGRVVEATRDFTILNTNGPIITSIPLNYTTNCADGFGPNLSEFQVEFNCGEDGTLSVSDPVITGAIGCSGSTVEYTYTAEDGCGRIASHTQTISFINDGPELSCPETLTILNCQDGATDDLIQAWIATVTATSACGGEVQVNNNYNGNVGMCLGNNFNTVTFFATDECGVTSTCVGTIIITDTEAPIIYQDPQEVLVPCNEVAQSIFENWLATQGGAEAIDGCWGNDITWSTNPANPQLGCENGPQAIVVEFIATDGCGNSSSVTGIFNTKIPADEIDISGEINTSASQPVEGVQVEVEGGTAGIPDMDYTSNTGTYGLPEVEYEAGMKVVPYKNDDPLNGITTQDLITLHKHILLIESLDTPYKMIAGDINRSGHISTLDMIHLRRLILFIDEEFQDNTSWRFVEAHFVFPNPTNPFETAFPEVYDIEGLEEEQADFIGVKIGDLNMSADPSGLIGDNDDRSDLDDLTFSVKEENMKEGQEYRIDFTAENFERINGFQYTLNFNQEALEVIEIITADLINFDEKNYGLSKLENGAITMSWNADRLIDLKSDEILFTVVVTANHEAKLSEVLSISSEYTKAEAYQAGELMNVNLAFETNGLLTTADKFQLFQNQPNPFKEATMIGFNLPEAGTVQLEIFDASGRMIYAEQGDYAKGYNQIDLDRADLPGGILYYQLNTATDSDSKKMILID